MKKEIEITPLVRELTGIAKPKEDISNERELYRDHLLKKHISEKSDS